MCQKPSEMVLTSPQLTISINLVTENFEYSLKSADRFKPTAVFHINRSRQKFSLTTSVLVNSYGPPARHMPNRRKKK